MPPLTFAIHRRESHAACGLIRRHGFRVSCCATMLTVGIEIACLDERAKAKETANGREEVVAVG